MSGATARDLNMEPAIIPLPAARRGHFRLESGHHGEVWLDLETLCLDPGPIRQLAEQLAARLRAHGPELICGPLVEGAFVALMVASTLGLPFAYAERFENAGRGGLFPVEYRIPGALRAAVRGRRVAIVNDVIGAGSAVRGTIVDLAACGARTVAIGSLAVMGPSAAALAADRGVALECLSSLSNTIWIPSECPLCARNIPLSSVTS